MENDVIPITRPTTQHSVVPDVVKKVLEKEGKGLQKPTDNREFPHESYEDIPQQFVEKTKYPTEVVELLSKGWFYPIGHPLSSGKVEIKMMTAREEDILTSQNLIKKGVVLQRLLDSLIVDKRIKQDEILLCDINSLFVDIRRLAYGDQYGPLKIKCPSCGEESEHTINLSSIEPKPFDFERHTRGQNAFTFVLPYSNRVVTYKMLTQREDDMVDAEIKSMSKVNKDRSSEITTRLKYVIQSIDGDEEKSSIRKFIETELVSRDNLALRTDMRKNIPDLDRSFNFVCSSCDYTDKMDMPMTVEFFWPSS